MKKDVATPTAGATLPPPFHLSCLDAKPFVATLLALALIVAIWQLQPCETHLSFRSCPIPTATSAAAQNPLPRSNLSQNPHQRSKFSPQSASLAANSAQNQNHTSVSTKASDPNKRLFRPYGAAAALLVQMGAYRGGPNTFALVGLASKPIHVFGTPWFKCEWKPQNPNVPPVRTKALKFLPDWGYGRVYTVVVVNCTFPVNPNSDNTGGKLYINAYYSNSSKKYERIMALEEIPGSYNESAFRPPFKYDYVYCGSSLYGDISASRIREWMAYHAYFFGPNSHFVFHDAGGVGPEVRKVLEPWVKAGRATLQDIRGQADYDGYYYNQFLVVNDCLHRYRHAANWTFYFDVDEYLYLPGGNSLASVLDEFSGYTQFTIEQNPMSSKLCVEEEKGEYSRQWGFEKLVFRNSVAGIRRDRKYAIQAKNAYATGVHMSESVIGKTIHKTETKIRYYHYHDSINTLGELCQELVPKPSKGNVTWFQKIPYVYDDNMKRIAETIKQFERQTIGNLQE